MLADKLRKQSTEISMTSDLWLQNLNTEYHESSWFVKTYWPTPQAELYESSCSSNRLLKCFDSLLLLLTQT